MLFPIIASCQFNGEGVDAERPMPLTGGGEIRDTIEAIDEGKRRLVYIRPVLPFLVTYYQAQSRYSTSMTGPVSSFGPSISNRSTKMPRRWRSWCVMPSATESMGWKKICCHLKTEAKYHDRCAHNCG